MSDTHLIVAAVVWGCVVLLFVAKAWQTLKDADAELEREEAWYAAYERRSRRIPDEQIDTDAA